LTAEGAWLRVNLSPGTVPVGIGRKTISRFSSTSPTRKRGKSLASFPRLCFGLVFQYAVIRRRKGI
jgi:hypothetical protein